MGNTKRLTTPLEDAEYYVQQICDMYKAGARRDYIADKLDLAPHWVSSVLKQANKQYRVGSVTSDIQYKIRLKFIAGCTVAEIAKMLGLHVETVKKHLKIMVQDIQQQ